jgi:hypothetical protein
MEESVIRIVMLIRAREIQRAIKNGHRQTGHKTQSENKNKIPVYNTET